MNNRETCCVLEKSIPQVKQLSTELRTAVYTSFTNVVPIRILANSRLSTYSTVVNNVVKN